MEKLGRHRPPYVSFYDFLGREKKEQVIATVKNFTNPFFGKSNNLFNLTTKGVLLSKIKKNILEESEIGQKLFDNLAKDRIKLGNINLWSPMKKRELQTWKIWGKKIKVSSNSQIVELQEDKNQFRDMMVTCRSRPEIDIQEA